MPESLSHNSDGNSGHSSAKDTSDIFPYKEVTIVYKEGSSPACGVSSRVPSEEAMSLASDAHEDPVPQTSLDCLVPLTDLREVELKAQQRRKEQIKAQQLVTQADLSLAQALQDDPTVEHNTTHETLEHVAIDYLVAIGSVVDPDILGPDPFLGLADAEEAMALSSQPSEEKKMVSARHAISSLDKVVEQVEDPAVIADLRRRQHRLAKALGNQYLSASYLELYRQSLTVTKTEKPFAGLRSMIGKLTTFKSLGSDEVLEDI